MAEPRARRPELLDRYTVVDADVHVRVPPERTLPYLDDRFHAHVKGGVAPSGSWNRYQSGKIDRIPVETVGDLETGLCDQFGIDHPIVNPSLPWLNRLPQPDLALALMRAYNDYLVDEFVDGNDDFYGLVQLATHRPHEAAEEIDRLGDEPGIVGIYLVSLGAEAPLGDPRYDVIYQAAEDHDLTIAYHSGTNAFATDFPKQNQGFNNFLPIHVLGHLWGQMQTLVSVVLEGTPEKFPGLNFVFLEAGVAWLPALMFKLNKEYAIRNEDAPLLERQPEAYIREFYLSSQPLGEPLDRADMERVLEVIDAPETLMFATDYPHWDFDNPSELFGYISAMYDDDAVARIMSGNASDAFGLDL